MEKFTESRQQLGRAIYALIKKYGDRFNGTLDFNGRIKFYAKHHGADEKYCVEYGFKYSDNGDGLFAVRKYFNRVDDAVSQRSKTEDLEMAFSYMPVVEEFAKVCCPPQD